MRVEVHIERLVVDGGLHGELTFSQRIAFREALCGELTRALAGVAGSGATGAAGWARRAARSVVVPLAPSEGPPGPAAAGRAVARSVHAALAAGRTGGEPA
jgi:hypothetical protein